MKTFIPPNLPLTNLDWQKYIPLIGKAHAEVACFDGLLQSIINPAVLLSPLTTNEAVLSSKIEGKQATLQEVLQFEADPSMVTKNKKDIIEILNYRKAMSYAVSQLKNIPLCNRMIKKIHSILLDSVRGQNKDRGNFRKTPVWIGKSKNIEEASYIPPDAQYVPDLMSNLEKYIHYKEKDTLIQIAILHAQFEMIHPFYDGNGRVGRIILPLFLYSKRILSSPMFYLSEYLEKNRVYYYQNLQNISQNEDWDSWIEFFLKAVIEQSKENTDKAKEINKLYEKKKERIVDLTHSQFAIKTLDFIFCSPIFTSTQFFERSYIPKQSAIRILNLLKEGGVIEIIVKGKSRQPNVYIFKKLLNIIK